MESKPYTSPGAQLGRDRCDCFHREDKLGREGVCASPEYHRAHSPKCVRDSMGGQAEERRLQRH